MAPTHEEVAAAADEIEAEMRRIGAWRDEPLPPEAYEFRQAFAADTMTIEQWLQFVFLPRVRQIVASRGAFPAQSQVGTWAVRNFDGVPEADKLVSLLASFDALIEG